MTEAAASFWLDAIAIGAGVFWLLVALFVYRSGSIVAEAASGEATVTENPHDFVLRSKEILARGIANSPLSRIQLRDVTNTTLTWEGGSNGIRHTASLRASGGSGRTNVVWQLEGHSGLITAARWVSAGGAIATAALYYLLSEYVLTSDNPGVRGQVLQMAQCIHSLWPPLLLAGMARLQKRRLVADLDRTLGNLKFDAVA